MPRRRDALTAVVVFLAAFLVHVGTTSGGFVYDDHRFIEHNRAIETLADPARFLDPRTASADSGVAPDIWRPLRTLDFAVDRAVFGLKPAPWHLMNALVHAANALLVWLLLGRLLGTRDGARAPRPEAAAGRRWAAALGALAFAVHPVTSEAVAWVSFRGDLLAMFFLLVAFEVLRERGALRTAAGAALVVLGVLAKESALVAAPLLFLVDRAEPAATRLPRSTRLVRVAVLAGIAVLYFVARSRVLPNPAQVDLPDGGRVALARAMLAGLAWYGRVLAWPSGFPFDYRQAIPERWSDPEVVLGAGLFVTVVWAGVRAWRRGDGVVAFACFGSLVTLLPVSNVVVPLKALTAERFLYPVLPCVVAGLASGVARCFEAQGRASAIRGAAGARGGSGAATSARPLAAGAVALLVLGGLAALTAGSGGRDAAWRSEESLWTAVRAEDPTNPRAYEGLGFVYLVRGDLDRAEKTYRTFREWQPDDGKSLAVLGDLYREVARSLRTDDPEMLSTTNVEAKRRFALRMAVAAYEEALSTWARVGLVTGRGSPAQRRATLERLRDAAVEIDDFATAKRANDMLAADDATTLGRPAYAERRTTAVLAGLWILASATAKPVGDAIDRMRMRSELFTAAGLDANRSDPDAADALLVAYAGLLRERPDDLTVRRSRTDLVIYLIRGAGRSGPAAVPLLEAALEDFEAIVAASPEDSEYRDLLPWIRRKLDEERRK